MPSLTLLLVLLEFALPVRPANRVTVGQLEHFLTSRRVAKESDSEVADALMRVELAEELTPATLSRIGREIHVRPMTAEQLRLLAAESVFEEPPTSEWIDAPAPDAAAQQRILSQARSYAAAALRHLPDFLAVRTTIGYDNAPQTVGAKRAHPMVRMKFARQHRRDVTYRNGAEVEEVERAAAGGASDDGEGFSTSGEFGPTLNMVLNGSLKGSVTWSHWQKGAGGERLAVFRYSVPAAASEYELHLCCFQQTVDDHAGFSFSGKPAYHGELFIHPDSGAVQRVTVEAELPSDKPLRRCSIEVEYGEVMIDSKAYISPVRGVAVLVFYSPPMEKIDGIGIEKHINEVRFDHYRKFGSTARIVGED